LHLIAGRWAVGIQASRRGSGLARLGRREGWDERRSVRRRMRGWPRWQGERSDSRLGLCSPASRWAPFSW